MRAEGNRRAIIIALFTALERNKSRASPAVAVTKVFTALLRFAAPRIIILLHKWRCIYHKSITLHSHFAPRIGFRHHCSFINAVKTMTFRTSELYRAFRFHATNRTIKFLALESGSTEREEPFSLSLFFLNKRDRGKLMLRHEIIICAVHSGEGESRPSYFAIVRRLESAERFVGTLPRQRFPHQFSRRPGDARSGMKRRGFTTSRVRFLAAAGQQYPTGKNK